MTLFVAVQKQIQAFGGNGIQKVISGVYETVMYIKLILIDNSAVVTS